MFKDDFYIRPDFFLDYKEEIKNENEIRLAKLSLLGSIVSFVLCLVSLFLPVMHTNISSYFCILIFCASIYFVVKKVTLNSNHVLFLFYLLLTSCFLFGLHAAVFSKNVNSTASFCVFLVAMPIFIIDKQWRIFLYLSAILATYLICGFLYKDIKYIPVFVVDGVSFYSIGLAVHYYNIRLRIKNLVYNSDLKKEAEIDSLTQLYNRSTLEKHVDKYIKNSKKQAAYILMDVDNFKGINDNFGHTTGDKLLNQTAGLLKTQFRHSDYIGRLGGDEFVIFLTEISDIKWLMNRMELLVEEMNRTFIGDEAVCSISGSIGIALYPQHGCTFDELYSNADNAMYESKKNGKNKYTIYGNDILEK